MSTSIARTDAFGVAENAYAVVSVVFDCPCGIREFILADVVDEKECSRCHRRYLLEVRFEVVEP